MNPSTTARDALPASSRVGMLATLCAAAIYCVVVHLLIVDHTMASLTLLAISAPWSLAAASATAAAARARSWKPATTYAVVALGLALSTGVAWEVGARLQQRVDGIIFAESFVFLLSLAGLFAVSLSGDREALVTRLARIARKTDLNPSIVRYTRLVTAGWAVFFALAATISAVLFLTQSRELWSAFVNLALWPLTAVAFAIEYAIRLRVLPDIEHDSPLVGVRTFMHRDAAGVDASRARSR